MRGNLPIGRVIRSFEADDARAERRLVLLQVSQEQQLRHRRPQYEDLVGILQGIGDGAEEPVFVVGVIVGSGQLVLRMPVNVVRRRKDRRFFESARVDVKDSRLFAVHPHRDVLAHKHSLRPASSKWRARDHGPGETLTLKRAFPAWNGLENAEFIEAVRSKLRIFGDSLQGREAEIFRKRLLNEDPATLARLAIDFGVTRERARQVEYRLKMRIRSYLRE